MGGYESATHKNTRGDRMDMIAGVQHDVQVREDYRLLRSVGMSTARDALAFRGQSLCLPLGSQRLAPASRL